MSGGFWNYQQYQMTGIADDIENIVAIYERRSPYPIDDDYSDNFPTETFIRHLTQATIDKFKRAAVTIREAAVYVHRIDWLLSDDDAESNFTTGLADELSAITKEENK